MMYDNERAQAVTRELDAARDDLRILYFHEDTDSPRLSALDVDRLMRHLAAAVSIVGELDGNTLRSDVEGIADILRDLGFISNVYEALAKVSDAAQVFERAYRRFKESLEIQEIIDLEMPSSELPRFIREISDSLIQEIKRRPETLYDVSPRKFEQLIAHILDSFGWQVMLTPPTKDGGHDIFAISTDLSGERCSWIIEAKRFAKHNKVGIEVVRQLLFVKGEIRAGMAMLATTSYFTKGVYDLETARWDLSLRDFGGVLDWINGYRPNLSARLCIAGQPTCP